MTANMTASRYELKELLGEGGMGVVYRALDTRTHSYVALKTLRDASDPATLEMFKHEWAELAKLSHPNIVDVRDVDEIEEGGVRKPCFIMPLLPGQTLAALIKASSPRLSIEFVVSVVSQVCKGLQAAHEKDLIHRDLKPSNIFVMDDDTAKIIDFGLVHAVGTKSVTGLKGTWQYMAPEQLEGKRPDRCSDIYSLGVVAYEALTGQQPFLRRNKLEDTVEAVRRFVPQAISEKNPKVSQGLSKAIHVAMAKQQNHRYSSAREFAETLQKAYQNQYIERFDPAKIRPRIDRAKRAFTGGDSEFASEILTELEVEGNLDAEITLLRSQINEFTRQKRVRQLFEAAQTRDEQGEVPLALEKLDEILRIDPQNPEAQAMRRRIEEQRSQQEVSDWLRLARQHLERNDFQQARNSLKDVFRLRYDDPDAARLKAEVDAREKEVAKALAEKEHLYSSALRAQQTGEISSALTKLKKLFELSRNVPGAAVPERDKVFQAFYNDVSTESDRIDNAYTEGTRHLSEKNFQKALQICDEILVKYPKKPQFQALRLKVEHAERQDLSAYIDEILRAVDAEPNLDRRVGLLEQARTRYPQEEQFQRQLSHARDLRDLISSIVAKARAYEDQEQFGEAIAQWNTLANIHPQYPGIDFEIRQLEGQRERQTEEEKKARIVEKIDRALESSAYDEAERLSQAGLQEFPQNSELLALLRLARQGAERTREANRLFEEAKSQKSSGAWDRALELLRQAFELDKRNIVILNTLVNLLVQRAHAQLDSDWTAAEPLAAEAARLDSEHQSVKKVTSLIAQAKKKDYVEQCVSRARELQEPDVKQAIDVLKQALTVYPNENRLQQTLTSLEYRGNAQPSGLHQNEDPFGLDRSRTLDQTRAAAVGATGGRGAEERRRYDAGAVGEQPPARKADPAVVIADAQDQRPPRWKTALAEAGTFLASARSSVSGFNRTHVYGALAGLAAAGVLISVGHWYFNRKPKAVAVTQPAAVLVKVTLQPTPSDAQVMIDGQPVGERTVSLKQGSRHQVSVARAGYKPVETTLEASDKPWAIVLEAQPLQLSVATSEAAGSVWLDEHRAGILQDGEWRADIPLKAEYEEHTLSVKNKGGLSLFALRFKDAAGKPATVEPLGTKDLLVASSLEKSATLYAGNRSATLTLAGKERQSIPPAGLSVNLDEAPDGFPINSGNHTDNWRVASAQAPTLSVALNAVPNLSTINISSSEKSSVLFVDDVQRPAKRPGFWSWTAAAGTYKAKLTASGMADEEFALKVPKGEVINRKFAMKAAAPTTATLVITDGMADVEIFVDGAQVGTLDRQGTLTYSGIIPGDREIQMRKSEYESRTFRQKFVAGQRMNLPGDKKLSPLAGNATFSVTPDDATVQYRLVGEQQWHPVDTKAGLRVPPGSYEFSAEASKYVSLVVPEAIAAGKTRAIILRLEPKIATAQVSLFLNQESAKKVEGDWWTGSSKAFLIVRPGNAKNTIFFPKAQKARHLIWTVALDAENEITYTLSSKGTSVSAIVDGEKKSAPSSKVDASDSDATYAVVVNLEPHGVRISKRDGTPIAETTDDKHDWSHARISIKGDVWCTVWLGR